MSHSGSVNSLLIITAVINRDKGLRQCRRNEMTDCGHIPPAMEASIQGGIVGEIGVRMRRTVVYAG